MRRVAMSSAFTFANGLRLFGLDLLPAQLERCRQSAVPLHEPVEKAWFECLLGETPPGRNHEILFEDPAPPEQPDGIVVARRRV